MRPWILRLASASAALLMAVAPGCDDDDGNTRPTVDTTPPRVVSVDPAPDAELVDVTTQLTVTFSEPIDPGSITESSIVLSDGTFYPILDVAKAGANELTFTPHEPLQYSAFYSVVVDSSLSDEAGNTMTSDYEWSFTTGLPALEPIDFPLAEDHVWLYQVATTRTEGESTFYEGLEVLWIEAAVPHEGRDGWRARRFMLNQKRTTSTALLEERLLLATDNQGLYRAVPGRAADQWRNLLVFGAEQFTESDFLLAGDPIHGDGATQSARIVYGPTGDYWAFLTAHEFTQTPSASQAGINELRREYYADGVGLVYAYWQYAVDDTESGGTTDYQLAGDAELIEPLNGPGVPYVVAELEPNDAPTEAGTEEIGSFAIVAGDVQLSDAGTVLGVEDIECNFFNCVNEDIDGVRILQDFWRVEIQTSGQYRFDMIYDTFNEQNDLDLYLLQQLEDGGLRSIARADTVGGWPEWIVMRNLDPGTYYLGVQAWNTPTPEVPVEYTISARPQVVPVAAARRGQGRFFASQGK